MRDVAEAVNALRERRPAMALLIITHYRVGGKAALLMSHKHLCRERDAQPLLPCAASRHRPGWIIPARSPRLPRSHGLPRPQRLLDLLRPDSVHIMQARPASVCCLRSAGCNASEGVVPSHLPLFEACNCVRPCPHLLPRSRRGASCAAAGWSWCSSWRQEGMVRWRRRESRADCFQLFVK